MRLCEGDVAINFRRLLPYSIFLMVLGGFKVVNTYVQFRKKVSSGIHTMWLKSSAITFALNKKAVIETLHV